MAKRIVPKVLKAQQIMRFSHPNGGDGIMMIDSLGVIYVKSDEGWIPFDMKEAPHGTEV